MGGSHQCLYKFVRICCRGSGVGNMFEEADEFADWAVDSEDNLSYEVIIRWKKKNTDPEVIAELEAWRNTCLKCE